MSDGVKLEACPRCGNGAFLVDGHGFHVWCRTDLCLRLPPRATEAEAIAAWNTRKSDDGWRTMESGGEVREALAYAAVGLTGSKVVMEFDGRQQAEQMYEALKRLNG